MCVCVGVCVCVCVCVSVCMCVCMLVRCIRCLTIDLGHFTVVLANFIATFRLYSDNLLQVSIIETLQ